MSNGLSVSRLVNVVVNLSPLAPARRGFGTLMVAGDSNVIDGSERFRSYSGLEGVALDFGLNAPEYFAAALYFGQTPKPRSLMVGRWLRTATAGLLKGGILTSAQQLMSNWTVITTGAFDITVDGGAEQNITGLDFSGAANLSAVAAIISAAITGATCAWDGSRFIVTSDTTGTSSTISYANAPASGLDISAQLKLTTGLALAPVAGFAAETAVACAAALAEKSNAWYGLQFAAATMPSDDNLIDVAALIQGLTTSRIFGVVETNTLVLDAGNTTDLPSRLKALGYTRTCAQFSANKYAIASLFGRAFSVNFAANRSTITLMYKQEPGVVAEDLTETQAGVLKDKRCNVFVSYDNDTAILQYGVMSGPAYFDEIHGLDWFQNAVQNSLYTLLYTSKTKIPQTDAGSNQLVAEVSKVCDEAINNGLAGPGVWNADGFGQLERGQFLKSGYYVYAMPMALQAQSEREQRKAPPIQVALKLAGAIQEIDVIVDVNR
jgi:hypothetical protein